MIRYVVCNSSLRPSNANQHHTRCDLGESGVQMKYSDIGGSVVLAVGVRSERWGRACRNDAHGHARGCARIRIRLKVLKNSHAV